MKINELIVDIGKQVQVHKDVLETLKKHTQDPSTSARLAFALIEIGINAFRVAGMSPFLVMAMCQMIAHGATTETSLKALMLIQEEDELKDEIDPERKRRRQEEAEADAKARKFSVH